MIQENWSTGATEPKQKEAKHKEDKFSRKGS
jgi:hypothetical protein